MDKREYSSKKETIGSLALEDDLLTEDEIMPKDEVVSEDESVSDIIGGSVLSEEDMIHDTQTTGETKAIMESNDSESNENESNDSKGNDGENDDSQGEKIGYKQVFSQVEYLKLIIANVVNRFGDSVDAIAFTWLVYAITGSASWTAIIFAMNRLPSVIVTPFAGAYVEKLNKKRIMVLTDVIRGVVTASIAVMYLTDTLSPWALLAVTLVNSSVEAFRSPAGAAFVPSILDMKYYTFASSLNNTLSSIVELVGLGLAGVIVGFFGIHIAIIIDVLTFLLSAAIIAMIRVKKEEKQQATNAGGESYLNTLKEGIHYVARKPVILTLCIMCAVFNALLVPLNTLQAPLIKDIFHQGAPLMSVIGIGMVIGNTIGAFIFPYISKKIKFLYCICLGGLATGVYNVLLSRLGALSDHRFLLYAVIAVATVIFGICIAFTQSGLSVTFMKHVDMEYMTRSSAILTAGANLASPFASTLLSYILIFSGVKEIMLIIGFVTVAVFLFFALKKYKFKFD
jgi:MFS family permease